MMTAEHRALADRGAQLVELRLDCLFRAPDLNRLIRFRPTPVVITCRREADKGQWKGTEELRLMTLRAAIVAGVEYVDLEEDTAQAVPRYGKTKRIISYHNFEETPADIAVIHARLAKLDADVVKLATMATSPLDNVRMLRLVAEAKVPTVGFCMGELGMMSRLLAGRYGAPFTYAAFSRDRTLAPGQFTFDEMRDVYRYEQITVQTELYGVLGDPIGHSLSPLLHNLAFKQEGLNKAYLPLRVPKEALLATLEEFAWFNFQGYSVTLPHKQTVLQFTSRYNGPIPEIGAANTLHRDAEGQWMATNTDYDAALESLKLGLAPAPLAAASAPENAPLENVATSPPPENPLAGKRVLMLGAGGVARAIGLGVLKSGGLLAVTNRTKERGEELASRLGCPFIPWDDRVTHVADVLVNCTSVGMHPDVDETPFDADGLASEMLVFDTVYNPEQTRLIQSARERGCRTVTGVEMFVRQAARQFELFTNRPAPLETMRTNLRKAISAVGTT